tara:strand:- start:174 stop:353 length:180 start_codon:yes stop_codon:yes gene_type:complete
MTPEPDKDYFYKGCVDPPEKLTGDCYAKRLNWLRVQEHRPDQGTDQGTVRKKSPLPEGE